MVAIVAVVISFLRGDFKNLTTNDFICPSALWSYGAGIALTIAVASLFRALSLGPASIVVPIYGMFIIGGSILGIIFLGEPLSLRKIIGIGLAVMSIILMTK